MMDEDLIKKNREIIRRIGSLVGFSDEKLTKTKHPEAWKLFEELKVPAGLKGAVHLARICEGLAPSSEDVVVEIVSSPRYESSKFNMDQVYAYKGLCNRLLEGAETLLRKFEEGTGHENLTLEQAIEIAREFADPAPPKKAIKGLLPPATTPVTAQLREPSKKASKKVAQLLPRYQILLKIIGDNEISAKEMGDKAQTKPYSDLFKAEGIEYKPNCLYLYMDHLKKKGAVLKISRGKFIVAPGFKNQIYKSNT